MYTLKSQINQPAQIISDKAICETEEIAKNIGKKGEKISTMMFILLHNIHKQWTVHIAYNHVHLLACYLRDITYHSHQKLWQYEINEEGNKLAMMNNRFDTCFF